jgi:cytidylate kinase
MNQVPIITIDGPSGVGKGTLAHALEKLTGYHFLDSGALYRALAYGVQKLNLDPQQDKEAVVELAEHLPIRFADGKILFQVSGQEEDITQAIRNETIAGIASQVAAIPEVRSALLSRQKAFATPPGLVADGRDMGTVVFPDAPVKFFLTASPEVRAQRRVAQLAEQGIDADVVQIAKEIAERDERDRNRKTAPLKPADDAIVIDTSNMTIKEVVDFAAQKVKEKLA